MPGPLATAGRLAIQAGASGFEWLDPLTETPVATIGGRVHSLPQPGTRAIVQTRLTLTTSQLPRLEVLDTLPSFWAQPSVWNKFMKGPSAYAGQEVDRRPRDFAGRLFTDHRAWAYDPGLLRRLAPNPTLPTGLGLVTVELNGDILVLEWNGRASWSYTVQSTPTLSRPFSAGNRILATRDGLQRATLKISPENGFFRVVESAP
ncbi:MAG: hypothetical protein JNN07_00440 [Verrucomicrobiales bacterium]|nr:hypothetical protein [Verrucomicrobiales bacterium]